MPGTLFECIDVASERAMLAVVRPYDPKRIHKKMNFDVEVATEHGWRVEATYRCTPIGNIISFERQFAALCRDPHQIAFLRSLLGDISCHGTSKNMCSQSSETPSLKSESPGRDHHPSVLLEKMKMRELNATQEQAVSSFLNVPKGSISIIQGYVSCPIAMVDRQDHFACLRHCSVSGVRGTKNSSLRTTNKAIAVLAVRFWAASKEAGVRIALVGDDSKLLDDSGGKKSPMDPFYIYNWLHVIETGYDQILGFCTGRKVKNDARVTGEQMWKQSVMLRDRLTRSLVDLPRCFVEKLEGLCEALGKSQPSYSNAAGLATTICKDLSNNNKFPKDQVRLQVLNSAHVIFSTLCSSASKVLAMTPAVDALIVDEAAAATEPDLYIPFQHRPSKLLIVGDPKQLPATVISDRARRLGLAVSLHERLMYRCARPYFMLDVQ